MIQSEMSEIDRHLFGFDIELLNWSNYWRNYCIGAKQYILREDLAHMPYCQLRNKRLKRIQSLFLFSLVTISVKLLFFKSIKLRSTFMLMLRLIFKLLSTIAYKLNIISLSRKKTLTLQSIV